MSSLIFNDSIEDIDYELLNYDTTSICTSASNQLQQQNQQQQQQQQQQSPQTQSHSLRGKSPSPSLEYRSYTPTYEEELLKFRKSSRGMSLDVKDTTSTGGDASMAGTENEIQVDCNKENEISCHNSNHNLHQEEKKLETTNDATISQKAAKPITKSSSSSSLKSLLLPPSSSLASQNKIDLESKKVPNDEIARAPTIITSNAASGNAKVNSNTIMSSNINKNDMSSESNQIDANITNDNQKQSDITAIATVVKDSTTPTTTTITATAVTGEVEENGFFKSKTKGIMSFLNSLNLDSRQHDGSPTEDVDANMEEFLRVPYRIEELMAFGMLICADSLLHILTVTPLKFIWSCICFLGSVFLNHTKKMSWCRFHRRHLYQFVRVFVIYAVYKYILSPISIGKMVSMNV